MDIIPLKIGGLEILFDRDTSMFSMLTLWKSAGSISVKKPSIWLNEPNTQTYIQTCKNKGIFPLFEIYKDGNIYAGVSVFLEYAKHLSPTIKTTLRDYFHGGKTHRSQIKPKKRRKTPNIKGSVIYFIQCADFIKIGFSTNVHRRFYTIQNGNPHTLTILKTIPGTKEDEKRFHKRFAHLRVRNEWFKFTGSLKKYLDAETLIAPPKTAKGKPIIGGRNQIAFDI